MLMRSWRISNLCRHMSAVLAAGLVVFTLSAQTAFGQTTRIIVLSSNGSLAVLHELAPQFEKATGNQLAITFSVAAELKKRIDGGEPFDFAILTPALMDDLIKQDTVGRESRTALARTGMAIAIRRGA